MSDLSEQDMIEIAESVSECSDWPVAPLRVLIQTAIPRLLREVRDLLAAKRADEERVRQVVRDRVDCIRLAYEIPDGVIEDLSDRLASQLASAAPVLSDRDRETLRGLRDYCKGLRGAERDALDRLLGASR